MATPIDSAPPATTVEGSRPENGSTSDRESRRRVGAMFGLLLVAFSPTLLSFVTTWSSETNEHGFFLAALVLWLVWRDRDRLFRVAGAPMSDLLPLVGLLSIAWLAALIMNVQMVHQGLFVILMTAWAFAVFGWGARIPILAMAVTLAFAVPVWPILVPILQRATVLASGAATKLAGITAEVGYDTITIQSGTFLVEQGCAGMRYLMAGIALGACYAHLFTRRWQTQVKIVALAAMVSIVGNWIRVTALIFLGEATAMQSPYIEDHLWQGWAVFTLLMIPTYFAARRIESRDAAPSRDGVAATEVVRRDSQVASAGVVARAAAFATVAAVVGPVLYVSVGAIPRGEVVERDVDMFGLEPTWAVRATSADLESWIPGFQGIDGRDSWLVSVDGRAVHAARYYFQDQRPGEELIQYNNAIAPDSLLVSERMFGPVGPDRRIVREAILWEGDGPRIAWYWYRVAGFDTPFPTKAKLLEVLAFFRRFPAAELVTLSARCAPESCAEAARTLRAAVGGPAVLEGTEPGA